MKSRIMLLTAVVAVSAIGGAPLENEDKAYGALHDRIVERIRLWPGLAPRDAQRHPEKYENLQVRVAGWNIRWNDIPRKEQDEYIRRIETVGGGL